MCKYNFAYIFLATFIFGQCNVAFTQSNLESFSNNKEDSACDMKDTVFFMNKTDCPKLDVNMKNVVVLNSCNITFSEKKFCNNNNDIKTVDGYLTSDDDNDYDNNNYCENENMDKNMNNNSQDTGKHEIAVDFCVTELIEFARKTRENAYCPYSKFKVGAAILTKDGKVYTGCNVENASYGLCNCAERTAIFNAVSDGQRGSFIKAIAIVLEAAEYGAPCGACRQVINEFSDASTVVIMATTTEKYAIENIATLLPYAFKLDV